MAKVFPIQETKFPLGSAREFGTLMPALFSGLVYPTEKGGESVREKKLGILADAADRFEGFNPAEDYLLIVGDPIFIGLAVAMGIAIDPNADTLKVLRYDKSLGRYLDIEVAL